MYQQFHLVDNLRVIHNVNAGHLGRWSFWKAALSLIFPMSVKTATAALTRVGIPEKLYARTTLHKTTFRGTEAKGCFSAGIGAKPQGNSR